MRAWLKTWIVNIGLAWASIDLLDEEVRRRGYVLLREDWFVTRKANRGNLRLHA